MTENLLSEANKDIASFSDVIGVDLFVARETYATRIQRSRQFDASKRAKKRKTAESPDIP